MLKTSAGRNRTPKGAGEPRLLEGFSGTVEALDAQAGPGKRLPFDSMRARDALKILLSEPNIFVEPFTGSWLSALGLAGWDRSKNVGYKITFNTGVKVLVVLLEVPEVGRKRFDGLKQLRERLGELGFSALEIWCSEDIAATVAGSQLDLMRRDLFRAEHRPDERAETIVLQKLNAVGGRAELAKCSGDFRAVVYSLIIKGKVRFCGPTLPYRQVELVGDARATIAFEPKFDLREEEYNPDALPATSVKTLFVRPVGDETTLIRALLGKKAKNASAAPSTSLPKRSAEMKSQRELSLQVIVATPKRGAAPFWERVQKEIANIERLLSGQGKLAYPLKAAPSIRNLKRWRKLYREIGPAASIPGYNRDSREGEAWRSEGGLKIDRALRQHMKRAPCL